MELLILVGLGIIVGVIGALLGIGGGFLIIPVLTLYFNLPIQSAIAVSLITIIAISSSATALKIKDGFVNIRLGTLLEAAAVPGAIFGAVIANKIPSDILKTFFALFQLVVSLAMFKKYFSPEKKESTYNFQQGGKSGFSGQFYDDGSKSLCFYEAKNIKTVSVLSFFSGFSSGLLGIGGGIINVPVLNFISKMPLKAATATSNFMMGATVTAGAIVYLKNSPIYPQITAAVVLGILIGSPIGAKIMTKIKQKNMYLMLGLLLAFLAVKMFISN